MASIRFFRSAFVVGLSVLVLAGCGQRSAAPVTPTINQALRQSMAPASSGYAYISQGGDPGGTFVFQLPLTANSQHKWTIGDLDAPGAIGFDPGQIFVLITEPFQGGSHGILVFEPRRNGPVSYVLPTSRLPEMIEVDKAGDIFQGQSKTIGSYAAYQINVFKAPIKEGASPAFTMATAVNHIPSTLTRGMAFDANGNLWVKDDDKQTMDKYVPPFSAKSLPNLRFPKGSGAPYGSLIFDAKNVMYVTNDRGIDVYHPPYTKHTTKAFTITNPSGSANSLAVDRDGNLYDVSTYGIVYVFAPPFSASSRPQVTLAIPGGAPGLPFIAIRR